LNIRSIQNTTDLSFITNEEGRTLSERFKILIKDSAFFDCLVGYFYISGFHLLEDSLRKMGKTRILVGLGISREVSLFYENWDDSKFTVNSEKQIKSEYLNLIKSELLQGRVIFHIPGL